MKENRKMKLKLAFLFVAIFLVIFTSYQLKYIGITMTSDDNEIVGDVVENSVVSEDEYLSKLEYDEVEEVAEVNDINENKVVNEVNDEANVSSNVEENVLLDNKDNGNNNNDVNANANNNDNNTNTEDKVVEDKNPINNEFNEEEVIGIDTSNNNVIENSENPKNKDEYENKELIYEDDELIVKISEVDKFAIPNNAKISVKPITDHDKIVDIYNKLEEKSNKEEKTVAGFLAYDISLVNDNGIESEPYGKVNVTMDYKRIVAPDYVEDLESTVMHLEEDNNGKVKEVVDLKKDNEKTIIETTDTNEVKKVEFETSSFSTFTITYRYDRGRYYYPQSERYLNYIKVNVKYVDQSGNEITANGAPSSTDLDVNNDNTIHTYDLTSSTYLRPIDGYTFLGVRYGSINGQTITSFKASSNTNISESINTLNNTYLVSFFNGDEQVGLLEYDSGTQDTRAITLYMVYTRTGKLTISDTIADDGCINAMTGTEIIPAEGGITYKWYKSNDGNNFTEVKRLKITGDDYNIPVENGPSINVAIDSGSMKYYRVEKYQNGVSEGSATYQVPYYDSVQNGSFEQPTVNATCTFLNDSNSNLVWKTTASDSKVEMIRSYGGDAQGNVTTTGVTPAVVKRNMEVYHFAHVPDGIQAVELNANMSGALYQDILSVPGSQLYWSLYHRARGYVTDAGNNNRNNYCYSNEEFNKTDSMYVLAMSTKAAEKYDVTTQAKVKEVLRIVKNAARKRANNEPLTEIELELEDAEIIKLTTTNNGNGVMEFTNGSTLVVPGTAVGASGHVRVSGYNYYYGTTNWHYYSGNFSIPEKQYLTRYFFVADETAVKDEKGGDTVGNMIDNISVDDRMPAPNAGQANLLLKKVVTGLDEFPDDYKIRMNVRITNFYEDTAHAERNLDSDYDIFFPVYDDQGHATSIREGTWSVPVNITPNEDEQILSLGESSVYEVQGYDCKTSYIIYKVKEDGTKETIKTGPIKEYKEDKIVINQVIKEKENWEVDIINEYVPNSTNFEFIKIDENGNTLPGAKFTLSNDKNTYEATSDANGLVTFENVLFGNYTLTETEAPTGYAIPNATFNVTLDKENGNSVTIDQKYIVNENSQYKVKNYDTEFTVKKVNALNTILKGASFKLYRMVSGIETGAVTLEDRTDGREDGYIKFENVKYNTEYYLEETVAPQGYYKLENPIRFKITQDSEGNDVINILNSSELGIDVNIEDGQIKVTDVRHTEMPKAGGIGIYWFYAIGILIMGYTIFRFINNKKIED